MIAIQQPENRVKTAAEFHTKADLDSISLTEATLRKAEDWKTLNKPLNLDITFELGTSKSTPGCAEFETKFHFRAYDAENPEVDAISIKCALRASYSLNENYVPETNQLEAFHEANAVYNCWPFFREYVQSSVVRMNLPAPPVPFLKVITVDDETNPEGSAAPTPSTASGDRSTKRRRHPKSTK